MCKLKSRKGLNKIFKYRPLSDFLFKELFYQEIYFASYNELNDPLDLSARVEFSTKDIEEIEYLIYFAFRTQFELKETSNYKKLVSLFNSKESLFLLKNEILKNLNIFLEENDLILTNDMVNIVNFTLKNKKFNINM